MSATYNLYLNVIGKDTASGVLGGVQNALGGLAKTAAVTAAAGFTALAGGIALSVKEAMGAEDVMADLEATLRSTGMAAMNTVSGMPRASREATAAMRDAANTHSEGIAMVAEAAAEATAELSKRAQELARQHGERIAEINQSIAEYSDEFASQQSDRRERLQETLTGIEEKYGDKRSSLEERLNQAKSRSEHARIKEQLALLTTEEATEKMKAEQRAQKEEARAEAQHQKQIARLQRQKEKENAEYERQTQRIAEEQAKQAKETEKHMARVEKTYREALDQIAEKFTAVERGIMLPQKIEQISREAILDLAGNLQHLTKFSDDTILRGQSMLLTFTNIGKDVFPDATEAMLDLATKMKTDVNSSAIMLGKALNSPVEGVTALRRVGVMLSDEQEKQIKQFVSVGRVADAQRIILKELKVEFGGVAKAAGQTLSGQIAILQNQFGDMLETIGGAFLPTLRDIAKWINENIIPAFRAWAEENAPKIQAALKQLGEWIQTTVLPALQQMGQWIAENVLPSLQQLGGWIQTTVLPALKDFGGWIQTTVIPALSDLWQWISENVLPVLAELAKWIVKDVLPALGKFVTWIRNDVLPVLGKFVTWIRNDVLPALGQFATFVSNVGIVLMNLNNTVRGVMSSIFATIAGWSISISNALTAPFKSALDALMQFNWAGAAWGIMRALYDAITGWAEWIFGAIFDPFSGAIDAIRRLLGIASPSKLMMEYGRQMARGLELGFQPAIGLEVRGQRSEIRGQGAEVNRSTVNHYNLTIHSQARTEQVAADFGLMRALASA